MNHKAEEILVQELKTATQQVPVGAFYAHYKHPDLLYKIIGHCILEANDEPAVLYQAQYGEKIAYARTLSIFLETVTYEGKTVPRFMKITSAGTSSS